eukprot:3814465-Pyramimonas_sp.AAC.1
MHNLYRDIYRNSIYRNDLPCPFGWVVKADYPGKNRPSIMRQHKTHGKICQNLVTFAKIGQNPKSLMTCHTVIG